MNSFRNFIALLGLLLVPHQCWHIFRYGVDLFYRPFDSAPTIMVLENMCYIFAFSNKIILAMLDLYWKSYPIVGLYSRYLIDLPCIHRIWYYWALKRLPQMSSQKNFWLFIPYDHLLVHSVIKAIWSLELIVSKKDLLSAEQVKKTGNSYGFILRNYHSADHSWTWYIFISPNSWLL